MDGNVVSLLKRMDLFSHMSEQEVRQLAKLGKARRLPRNQVLFRQGDAADSLYIVVSGRLRVSARDDASHEKVLAFIGTGDVVGEMGVLSGEPRSATVTTSTDAELLQLRKPDFDKFMASNVDLMRDFARAVVRRREATQQRSVEESGADTGYRQGLITTVFSPRGGAGTTTLATNLAVALAQRVPDRVVLIDLNILFGHVPVLLNLLPRTSLAAISPNSLQQMDRENLEFYLTTHAESSLRVLSSTLRPEEGELVTAAHVKAVVQVMRAHFAHVVIDLERGFSEVNLAAIEATHNLLIVCTPERIGVHGVSESQRIFRELLHLPGDPMQYVLNHSSSNAALSDEQVEQELGIRLVASIPFGGDAAARAALEGQPLVMRFSGSATSKALNALADRMEQQLAEARALAPGGLQVAR